jgi:uncharacterized transporter YbjL
MKVGYFEAAPEHKSMGRLLAFIVIAVAMAIALGAFTVLVIAFASGDTDIVGSLVGLITASFGVASVGEIMKNWAKRIEARGGKDVSES